MPTFFSALQSPVLIIVFPDVVFSEASKGQVAVSVICGSFLWVSRELNNHINRGTLHSGFEAQDRAKGDSRNHGM